MTTTAANATTMAGDGQAGVADTVLCTARQKVHRLPDGSLLGCSGRSADSTRFRAWMVAGRPDPAPKLKELAALVLRPDGALEYWNEMLEPSEPDIPCAVGSGQDFAIGAMDAGATPEEAVRIACKRDPFSGGHITVFHLEPASLDSEARG